MRRERTSIAGSTSRNRPIFVVATLLLLVTALAPLVRAETSASPSSWGLRLRTTAYAFESRAESGDEEDRLGGYQHFDTWARGLHDGKLRVRLSGRFADELRADSNPTDSSRLYVGYAQLELPAVHGSVRLGRQMLHEGVASQTMDGLRLAVKPMRRVEVRGWAGARAPLSREFEVESMGENTTGGVRLLGTFSRRFSASGSWAYTEREERVVARRFGFQANLRPNRSLRVRAAASYEGAIEDWNRTELLTQWAKDGGWPRVSLQLVDRRPWIDPGSYFARFVDEAERIRLGRASVSHVRRNGFGGEAEFFVSDKGDQSAQRLGLALVVPHGRVGYSRRLGDAGTEGRVYGEAALSLLDRFRLRAGASWANYELLDDLDDTERELITAFAGVDARIWDGVTIHTSLQRIEDPFYDRDIRLLVGLDVLAASAPSRLGLNRRGE